MGRYIDADGLIKSCDRVINFGVADEDGKHSISVECVKKKIEIMPAADVRENVRGEWLRHYDEDGDADGYSCSVCAEWYYFGNTTPNFCPNCGADMRGEEE